MLFRSIERDPSEGLLHHNLAVILHRTNRHEESLIAHQRAKRLGLENADSLYNLGNTLQSLGELEQACEAYESACSRDPGHLLAQADLARLRWRLEDPQWHRTLMGALQHPSQQANAKLLGQFAHLLWKAGHVEDALETWQRAEVLEPDQVQWKDAVGRCLVRLGHLEEGLRKQRKALATEETADTIYVNYFKASADFTANDSNTFSLFSSLLKFLISYKSALEIFPRTN